MSAPARRRRSIRRLHPIRKMPPAPSPDLPARHAPSPSTPSFPPPPRARVAPADIESASGRARAPTTLQKMSAYGAPLLDGAAAAFSVATSRLSAKPLAEKVTGALSGGLWASGALMDQLGNSPRNGWVTTANLLGWDRRRPGRRRSRSFGQEAEQSRVQFRRLVGSERHGQRHTCRGRWQAHRDRPAHAGRKRRGKHRGGRTRRGSGTRLVHEPGRQSSHPRHRILRTMGGRRGCHAGRRMDRRSWKRRSAASAAGAATATSLSAAVAKGVSAPPA